MTYQRKISWHPVLYNHLLVWIVPSCFIRSKHSSVHFYQCPRSLVKKGVPATIRHFSEDRKMSNLLSAFCFPTPRNSSFIYKYHQNWYAVNYLIYILNVRKKQKISGNKCWWKVIERRINFFSKWNKIISLISSWHNAKKWI